MQPPVLPPEQKVNLIGAPVLLAGPSAAFHMAMKAEKLQKHLGDCGTDIFPSGIRVVKKHNPIVMTGGGAGNTQVSLSESEQEAYEVIELSKSKRIINVETGLHWTPALQCFGLLTERSSSIEKLNGGRVIQGIIDSGYTGELIIRIEALTDDVEEVIAGLEDCIEHHLAIAQMILMQFPYPVFQQKSDGNIIIPNFAAAMGRGANGFGSTDKIIKP